MNIGNITSDNFNLDGNGKDIQIEVYEPLIEQLQQENQELKEELVSANESITWWNNRFNAVTRDNEQLKNKIKELVKYGYGTDMSLGEFKEFYKLGTGKDYDPKKCPEVE